MDNCVILELIKKWKKQGEPPEAISDLADQGDEAQNKADRAYSKGFCVAKQDCAGDLKTLIDILGGE
jgi:hypothetical protein